MAKANHIDISNLRARQFTALDCELFDKIYVMAADVLEEVKEIAGKQFNPGMTDYFLNELHPGRNEDVFDPGMAVTMDLKKCTSLLTKPAMPFLKVILQHLKQHKPNYK